MSEVNPYQSSPASVEATRPFDSPAVDSPPVDSPSVDSSQIGRVYMYGSAGGRASFLTVLFAVTGVWHALMIGLNLAAIYGDVDGWGEFQFGDIQIGDTIYSSFWISYSALAILMVPIYLTTIVVFCMWIHRSNANARALGAEGMYFTPGWCVGWFFIPFMNLIRPFQAVREIYRASDPECGPRDWKQSRATVVLHVWWNLWIVTNIMGNIEGRMGGSDDPEILMLSCWLGVVGSALGIVLCLAITKIVCSIQARLHLKAVKLGAAMEFEE